MKITRVDAKINSTSDCVNVLNQHKKSKWKRKSKFNLYPAYGDANVVRVFTDGIEFVTLIQNGSYILFCQDLDLNKYKPIIDKINSISKYYWTHDYGDIWFNPEEMKVWVSGGDGGIFYSEKPAAEVVKKWDEGDFNSEDEAPEFDKKIPELKSCTFEAECSPQEYEDHEDFDDDNEEKNYILIGHINDVCNFESN